MRLRLNLSKIPKELIQKSESGDAIVYLRIFKLLEKGKYNATHGCRVIHDRKFSGEIHCGNGWADKYD